MLLTKPKILATWVFGEEKNLQPLNIECKINLCCSSAGILLAQHHLALTWLTCWVNGEERPGRAERTEAKEYQVFKEMQEMQSVSRVSFKWTNDGEEVSGGEVGTGLWGDP